MIQVFESGIYSISSAKVESNTYFRAQEVAKLLGYQDTKQAVRDQVSPNYKKSFRDLLASMVVSGTTNAKLDGPTSMPFICQSQVYTSSYLAVSYHKPNSSESGYLSRFYLPSEPLDPTSYPKPSTTRSY